MLRECFDIKGNVNVEADVCVIGTGAGGAVVAKELAEKGLRVVALEEGSCFTRENFNQDPCDMMGMMYREGGTSVTFGLPPMPVMLGRAVGGATVVNFATCFRTPKSIVEEWVKDYDCRGLDYERLSGHLDRVEKEIAVGEPPEDVLGNVYGIMKRGAKALGYEIKPLKHNVKNCEGTGGCQWGCVKNAKQSADLTYIPKAMAAGADIYANCRAMKVCVENGRVRYVEGLVIDPSTNRRRYRIKVRADVVCLAMGALITPAFMLKNRLANSSGLVGKGLSVHPSGRVIAEMDEEVNGNYGISQCGYIDAFMNDGIMLEGIAMPPGVMAMALPGVGEDHKYIMRHYRNLAAFGVMISDSTRGFVRPGMSGHAFQAFYSMNKSDAARLHEGLCRTAEIFLAAGARRVFTGCSAMPVINNREDLHRFEKIKVSPWHFSVMALHPLGTCRMGNDPRTSVVDINLEAHDVKGLFIPDGSPFPTPLGVSPQVTIMAFATRCAEYISANINKYKGV